MRSILSIMSVLIFAAGAKVHAADDAKTILTKAIEAHGGEENLAKYKAARTKGKGKITLPGLGDVDFTQEVTAMLPDKMKEILELDIANQKIPITTLINGDKISIDANGTALPINDAIKKAIGEARHMAKVARLTGLLKEKEYDLSVVGDSKVEGKATVGILVSRKGQRDITLHFNKETGLLAKLEHRTVDPTTEKEFAEERIILEYTKTDKMPHPKKVLVKRDGEKFMEVEVLDVKLLDSIDEGEFKK